MSNLRRPKFNAIRSQSEVKAGAQVDILRSGRQKSLEVLHTGAGTVAGISGFMLSEPPAPTSWSKQNSRYRILKGRHQSFRGYLKHLPLSQKLHSFLNSNSLYLLFTSLLLPHHRFFRLTPWNGEKVSQPLKFSSAGKHTAQESLLREKLKTQQER